MFAIGGLCLLLWLAVVNASNSSEVQVGSGNYALKDGKVALSDEFGIYNWPGLTLVPDHLYPNCSTIRIDENFMYVSINLINLYLQQFSVLCGIMKRQRWFVRWIF